MKGINLQNTQTADDSTRNKNTQLKKWVEHLRRRFSKMSVGHTDGHTIGMQKDAQHHYLLENCKSNPQ